MPRLDGVSRGLVYEQHDRMVGTLAQRRNVRPLVGNGGVKRLLNNTKSKTPISTTLRSMRSRPARELGRPDGHGQVAALDLRTLAAGWQHLVIAPAGARSIAV